MPDPTAFLPALLIVVMGAVLLWFALGTQRNIGRGNRLLAWLSDGLPALGPRTTMRWLGSSVAELRISEPRAPYREALVMVVLEPRDLGALWAVSRSRGRRDFLLLRLTLLHAPLGRAHLLDPTAWTAGDRRPDEVEPQLRQDWTDAAGRAVEIRHDPHADVAALRGHWDRLGQHSGGAWRLSVRRSEPHLEIHLLPPPEPDRTSSRQLFAEVAALATSLAPR